MTFDTLGLLPESLHAVADQGYTEATPVQTRTIPLVLQGRDLLVGAQTGTGKTAAFVLPMLQLLHASRRSGPGRVRGLVVAPTRELALQVEQSVRVYGARRPIRSVAIYGGVRMDPQVRALRSGVEIVVATPGRLLDHVRQRTVDLRGVEILVLDEADRMLDMGFIHDIRRILELLPEDRQSLLFSATFTPPIRRLAEELLRDPVSIDVAPRNATAAPIRQVVHRVDRGQKRHLLSHLSRSGRIGQALVFTRTKRGADRLALQLGHDGIGAAAIHGNKSQSQRVRALSAFKQGRVQMLVATDVAARGLDIEALPHVVNYDLPTVPEDYVHRIGRTGRAGQEGTAISLVSADEEALMAAIEKLLKRPVDREIVAGFEAVAAGRPTPQPATKPRDGRDRREGGSRQAAEGIRAEGWVGQRAGPSGREGTIGRQGSGRRGSAARGSSGQPRSTRRPSGRRPRGSGGRTTEGSRSTSSGTQGDRHRSLPGERLSFAHRPT